MPLTLFRRHLKSCAAHRLGLTPTLKRAYMDCECPILIYGRIGTRVFERQSTGTSNLAEAQAIRAKLVAEANLEVRSHERLDACVVAYLASRRPELSEKTYAAHKRVLEQLERYCEQAGAHFMDGLTPDLIRRFRGEGLGGMPNTSKAASLGRLRCFLRHAERHAWVSDSGPACAAAKAPENAPTTPFSEDEVRTILDEALRLNRGTHGYAKQPGTFRLMLELMLETGMRVADATRFDPALLIPGSRGGFTYKVRTASRAVNTRTADVEIPQGLKQAIDECTWLSERLPFAYASSRNSSYLANQAYERMLTIGSRCGIPDCVPHRLRATFAARKLREGVGMERLCLLLGHFSVRRTEAQYAKWMPPPGVVPGQAAELSGAE